MGSDAANPYGGLDRFGRVIDNLWNLPDLSTTLDLIQYGYDRVGNRIWRYNLVAHTHSAAFDEPYSYDGLNQLTDMQRGSYSTAPTPPSTPPSGFSSTPTLQQTWSLDSTGNWSDFTEALSGSTTLVQTRKANRVNEITEITNSTGSDWQPPVYDAAGNMTLMPQPASPGDGFAAVYDAWNRLVRIDDVSGESPVAVQVNAYDGLTRRVSKTTFGEAGEIRHYYYDLQWRVIEEYVGATPNRSNREDWDRIYAWGLRYIDELALRLRAVEGEDPEALVALQDANWNVTAICDGTAAVVERYAYTAYGTPTFQDDTFATLSPNESAYNWETLYAGYRFDGGTGLYHVRWRVLHSVLGVWMTRDPKSYLAKDINLFRYVGSDPLNYFDFLGLERPGFLPSMPIEPLKWYVSTEKSRPGTCCGPDVTSWFAIEIRQFRERAQQYRREYRAAMDAMEEHNEVQMFVIFQAQLVLVGLMRAFGWLGIKADYKMRDYSTANCPSTKCSGTVTLCGKCITTNQLGNIMFGVIAVDMGLVDDAREYGRGQSPWYYRLVGASSPRPTWLEEGQAYRETAFDVGIAYANAGAAANCQLLDKNPGAPVDFAARGCTPCSEKFAGPHTDWKAAPLVDSSGNIPGRK